MGITQQKLDTLLSQIKQACLRSQRNPLDVQLIAVTKTQSIEQICQAMALGIQCVGENKAQELKAKFQVFSKMQFDKNLATPSVPTLAWHYIGSLQTNKVKDVVPLVSLIHSVDRLELAQEINKRCLALGKVMPILIQVNCSGESSKHGCQPEKTFDLVKAITPLPAIKIIGLMTMAQKTTPPQGTDDILTTKVRKTFSHLRRLKYELNAQGFDHIIELSMGMSDDFQIAIEEGATIIRIGSALF